MKQCRLVKHLQRNKGKTRSLQLRVKNQLKLGI
jgi:hypothetical protein